jgi:hypothetical protein
MTENKTSRFLVSLYDQSKGCGYLSKRKGLVLAGAFLYIYDLLLGSGVNGMGRVMAFGFGKGVGYHDVTLPRFARKRIYE